MTPEQIKASTQKKVADLNAFLLNNQLALVAKEVVTKEGFIETQVFYVDNEIYPKLPKNNEKTSDEQAKS